MGSLTVLRLRKVLHEVLHGRVVGLSRGIAASVEHKCVLERLQIDAVVDVGANVGQFSLLARDLWGNVPIYAFEPQGDACEKFSKTVTDPVSLERVALSDTSGRSDFFVTAEADSSSLRRTTQRQTSAFSGSQIDHTETVSVRTLDSFALAEQLPRNSLMKVDVQGSEREVLRGGMETVARLRYLYLELSFVELYQGQALALDVLSEIQGMVIRDVANCLRDADGSLLQADCLLERVTR